MEGRGWSFLRDENYARIDPSTVPKARRAQGRNTRSALPPRETTHTLRSVHFHLQDLTFLISAPGNPSVCQDFEITNFRNDVYRSIGGFLRVYDVLKRGKTLEVRGLVFRRRLGLIS